MNIKEVIVSGFKKLDANFMPSIFSSGQHFKTPLYHFLLNVVWLRKLSRLKSSVLQYPGYIIVILLSGINTIHATMTEELTIIPTIKAPPLLHINIEGTAQYAVKNLGRKTVTLMMMPQEGVTQKTTGLLACRHPFTLRRGQKCLLNLKITGHKVGQKIAHGPLICEATKKGRVKPVTSCAKPSIRENLNITIVEAKKAIIAVKPRALNIHATSVSPKMLTVTNHSMTVTAQNITADLPDSWGDVKQNANDCMKVKPHKTCKIFFTAKNARSVKTIMVSGSNTTKVPVKIRVE